MEQFSVLNPATGAIVGSVRDMSAEDTRVAIDRASAQLPAWSAITPHVRAQHLKRWCRLIEEHAEQVAALITAEQGKPLAEARSEVAYAASFVEWFAEEATRAYGDIVATPASHQRVFVLKQPVGVVAAITPWNFPAAMLTRKVAPALAAGCTVVMKPSELTPLTALRLAELASDAGIPADALVMVTGRNAEQIGAVICDDPRVRKISFTGSTAVGKHLMRRAADSVKRLSLELGGNAPFIVLDDADVEAAIRGVMLAKFRNAGQTCVCANRILVHDDLHDVFVERLAHEIARLRPGHGIDPAVTIGPLISRVAVDRVTALVEDACARGAKRIVAERALPVTGCFFPPTLLTRVSPDMAVCREEIFGPVAPIVRFRSDDEVVELANTGAAGLAAYVFTEDERRGWAIAERLECGMVGFNEAAISNASMPFGGIKQSGFGREGSRYGIDEFLALKSICVGRRAVARCA